MSNKALATILFATVAFAAFVGTFLGVVSSPPIEIVSEAQTAETLGFGGFDEQREIVVMGTSTNPRATFYETGVSTHRATTTNIVRVGSTARFVDLQLYAVAASTSPLASEVYVVVHQSADKFCDDPARNTKWFDTTSGGSGTTTNLITGGVWTPTEGSGIRLQFTNVNTNCFRVQVGATSTELDVRAYAKDVQ